MSRLRLPIVMMVTLVLAASAAAQDPIDIFIAQADSTANAGGDEALVTYLATHEILVGAAVGLVLDIAFEVSLEGNTDGEKENVDFAARVARVEAERGGSKIPLGLVETYNAWTAAQRKTRAKAMQIEVDAVAARDAGLLDKAADLYTEARALYEQIGDRRSVAVNWGSMGVTHWYTGDWDVVIADYEQALAARRAIEDRILEGKTLNGLGSCYQQKGEYEKSADYYDQAVTLRRQTRDFGGLGTSLTYLGNSYLLSGRVVDARDKFEEALPILERLGSPAQMVDLLNSIALLYNDMGRIAAANETYQRGIEIALANDLVEQEIPCRLNLADNLRRHSLFGEALAQYERVESLLETHVDATRSAELLHFRGLTYLMMGDYDRATEDLVAGARAAAELEKPDLAIAFQISISLLYLELGANDRALETALRAKQMAVDAANAREYRRAVVQSAVAQRILKQDDASLASYMEALEQDEYDGVNRYICEDMVHIGLQNAVLGNFDEARKWLYDAHERHEEAGASYHVLIHLGLGETFEKEEPDSAASHYDRSLELISGARASLGAAETETGYFTAERRSYFEQISHYYATLSESGTDAWSEKAFETMERARSQRLLDRMSLSIATSSTPEEERILDEIYRLDPSSATYSDDERRLGADLESLRKTRARDAFGNLAEPELATIDDVRSILPKKTVALSYALGDSASLLWAIDRKGATFYELPPRSALEDDVARLRDAIAKPGAGDATLRKTARSLYRLLVEPAQDQLDGVERIVIFPDGFLFELPFEALLAGDSGENAEWKDLPYLGRDHATLYAPSPSVYVQLSNGDEKTRHDLDLLAFGAPDYTTLDGKGAGLAPLPYAVEEVTAISARVKEEKREVRVGVAATESALKQGLRDSSPRVVHLATHGLVDAAEPGASSVVLARDNTTEDDGYFRAVEIAAAPCAAGVVVMSACESARGRVTRGEGVIGLTQAFFASGADGVVASLWSVSDESTSELMKVFYERLLGKKKSAAEAMKTARVQLIENERFAHPFYWSPFIVMGTDEMPW